MSRDHSNVTNYAELRAKCEAWIAAPGGRMDEDAPPGTEEAYYEYMDAVRSPATIVELLDALDKAEALRDYFFSQVPDATDTARERIKLREAEARIAELERAKWDEGWPGGVKQVLAHANENTRRLCAEREALRQRVERLEAALSVISRDREGSVVTRLANIALEVLSPEPGDSE